MTEAMLQTGPPGFGPTLLSLEGITKRFGNLVANDGLDLTVRSGEILALLGENGAGKTTLMNILFGHYVPEEGSVRVASEDGVLTLLPHGSPGAALAAGVGMVHQHFTLAENLTGLENIVLGTEPVWNLWRRTAEVRRRIESVMKESGLVVDLDVAVADLSVGEKQRVEILKALCREVRVLILDEPTAVLTPQEAEGLFVVLRKLAGRGLGVIFISHKLGEVLAVSNRIVVLRSGRKAGELLTANADRRAIAEMMVGAEVQTVENDTIDAGEPVLELAAVTLASAAQRQALKTCSFTIRAHEIVGVAGVSGNGQQPLAALLTGLAAPDAGEIRLFGRHVKAAPGAFVAAGVARIPEDRHHDGVVGTMTVAENISLEDIGDPAFQTAGFLNREAISERATAAISNYDIRCPGPDAEARLLSGGNIQKLILARVLERDPGLILANQPTRGLDVGAQAEIHRRLLAARDRGAGVLLISEDLDEVLALSNRLLVIHAGELVDAGPTDQLDRASVGLMMAGHTQKAAGGATVETVS